METSYWKFCYVGHDGERICDELYAELPPELDGGVRGEVTALAELERIAGGPADAALRVRLFEALDDAAVRLNTRMSDGFELRRSDGEVRGGSVGVPLVVGMSHVDGFNTLRAAGYQVRTVWEWTSSTEENTISDQAPGAGAANLPPTMVHIWVRTLPPEPVPPIEPETILPR